MITFTNLQGQSIARIDNVAQIVYTIMDKISLIKEATQVYNHGSGNMRYHACNVLEYIRKGHYKVMEVTKLPNDVLPSECHIG